jgi:AcrR family transcriptional regulator
MVSPGDVGRRTRRLRRVARWQPDARGRLQKAALALYAERGYEATTVADIAERAGLTKRTFFRHFADKREVFFEGSETLQELFVAAVLEAPESAAPLDAVAAGLDASAAFFEGRRDYAAVRQRIVLGTPELLERELIKLASMVQAVAAALRQRGVGDPAAALAAEAGIAIFRVGFARWVAEGHRDAMGQILREALDELRAVAAA